MSVEEGVYLAVLDKSRLRAVGVDLELVHAGFDGGVLEQIHH